MGWGKEKNKKKYYAVVKGREPGIYETWPECEAQVKGVSAIFKGFSTLQEAKEFIEAGGRSAAKAPAQTAKSKGKRKASEVDVDDDYAKGSKAAKSRQYTDEGIRIIEAYTDGASAGNGKVGAKAGWGVHWPEARSNPGGDLVDLKDESARLPGALQTNNRAELTAIVRACQICSEKHADAKLRIFTDSSYSINAITQWQHKWRKNKWMLQKHTKDEAGNAVVEDVPVSNRDLIRRLEREMRKFKHRPEVIYVKGHSISPSNNEADRLAVAGARLPEIAPDDWPTDLEPPPSDTEEEILRLAKENKEKALEGWMKVGFTPEQANARVNDKG